LADFYHGRFKLFLILPLVLFVVFLGIVGYWPGITQGVDLKGGSLLFIDAPMPVSEKEVLDFLNENFDLVDVAVSSISSPLGNKIRIQFVESKSIALLKADMDKSTELLKSSPSESKAFSLKVLEKAKAFVSANYSPTDSAESLHSLAFDAFLKARQAFNEGIKEKLVEHFKLGSNVGMQSEDINPVLGQMFWQGALWVGLLGLIFILIVIFIFFRELVPTLAIVFSACFDALAALAAMAVFNVPLSLATIPTVLLVIGYSIDTDIMLTTRVLKRKDNTASERASESLITGVTMTSTALIAVIVMMVLSYFAQVDVMFNIAFILVFGLLADLIGTWLMNAPMLLWYVEGKNKNKEASQ
jgi:preprotein translocase subunit SecF